MIYEMPIETYIGEIQVPTEPLPYYPDQMLLQSETLPYFADESPPTVDIMRELRVDDLREWDVRNLSETLRMELGMDFLIRGEIPNDFDQIRVWEELWERQTLSYSCGVAVQRMILSAFGIEISEAELIEIAREDGSLTKEGMDISRVGELLERYGIEISHVPSTNIEEITDAMESGRLVIGVIDAGELWNSGGLFNILEDMEDHFIREKPDHVVWVLKIDSSDPENPRVIINDSGHPNGAGASYPLDVFLDAWADSNFYCIITDEAPPTPAVF